MNRSFAFSQDDIKPARLAGSWYPAQRLELDRMLDRFLADVVVPGIPGHIGVIISPHAGYPFSGAVAAHGFKAAQFQAITTVIILAPTHHFSFAGASLWPRGAFETPLGQVLVDEELASRIMAQDETVVFRKDVFDGKPDRPENSIETQIPFIQKVWPQARIVPVIMGFPPDQKYVLGFANALARAVGDREDVLLVVSVDQSHFHPLAQARDIDRLGLDAIEALDVEGFWDGHVQGRMEVDGFHVVTAAMLYARARGLGQSRVLKYATSEDVTREAASVVGYASAVFSRQEQGAALALTPGQKKRLVMMARKTLEAFVKTGKAPSVKSEDARFLAEEGAFVTLKKDGRLRGCIGRIIGEGPLWETVREMTMAAASRDARFPPVTAQELAGIDIEISVLSRPRTVTDASGIVMGTHGVIVRQGDRGGVFLPQVAVETGWGKERFLSELCSQKAGLPLDCWKDPSVSMAIFTADVFGEKE